MVSGRIHDAEKPMSATLAEHLQIQLGQRIVGADFQNLAGAHPLQALARSENRLRAFQPQRVKNLVGRIAPCHCRPSLLFCIPHSTHGSVGSIAPQPVARTAQPGGADR